MVPGVEHLVPELELLPLRQSEALVDSQVPVVEARTDEDVAAAISGAWRRQQRQNERRDVPEAVEGALALRQAPVADPVGIRNAGRGAVVGPRQVHARAEAEAALEERDAPHPPP